MIVDMRMYTIHPGRMGPTVDFLANKAVPIQRRHLGAPIGYFATDIGPLNRLVHLWLYESLADRETKRAALFSDPDWADVKAEMARAGHSQFQENWILKPLPFSPIGGEG